jgi:hypothetical protein
LPKLFNLRTDPYEFANTTSNTYWDWYIRHVFIVYPAQGFAADFMSTFREFPPAQHAASFTIDQAMDKMTEATGGGSH